MAKTLRAITHNYFGGAFKKFLKWFVLLAGGGLMAARDDALDDRVDRLQTRTAPSPSH
jgi:hypothetical protein